MPEEKNIKLLEASLFIIVIALAGFLSIADSQITGMAVSNPNSTTIKSTKDLFIYSSQPTLGKDGRQDIQVGNYKGKLRTLLYFDTSALAGKTIRKAEIRMYNYRTLYSSGFRASSLQIGIYKLKGSFSSGSTWNSAPDFDAAPLATKEFSNAGWYAFDVTGAVQGLTSNNNYGFMLKALDENVLMDKLFYASERYGYGPQLVVEYGGEITPPPTVCTHICGGCFNQCSNGKCAIDAYCPSEMRIPCNETCPPMNDECTVDSECVQPLTCTDSDGGKNYNVRGTVTYGQQTFEDNCITEITNNCPPPPTPCPPNIPADYVVEYFCDNNTAKSETHACGPGIACQGGACINTPPPCTKMCGGSYKKCTQGANTCSILYIGEGIVPCSTNCTIPPNECNIDADCISKPCTKMCMGEYTMCLGNTCSVISPQPGMVPCELDCALPPNQCNIDADCATKISIITPPDGFALNSNFNYEITWTSSALNTGRLRILFYNGTGWQFVAWNLSLTQTSYVWKVPNIECSNCMLRVGSYTPSSSGSEYDQWIFYDNATFSIKNTQMSCGDAGGTCVWFLNRCMDSSNLGSGYKCPLLQKCCMGLIGYEVA
jgi:hypothetical protein